MARKSADTDMSALERHKLLVPRTISDQFREVLLDMEIDGHEAYNRFIRIIMAELLSGRIDPEIAEAAKTYAELLLTSVTAAEIQKTQRSVLEDSSVAKLLATANVEARKKLAPPTPFIDINQVTGENTIQVLGPNGETLFK
tara:strand:- start:288 stop:713 length:426 start_codon:yes stop_codon:yes gene_type:complete